MNLKQSCKALICAIEGELDGRHCTEEQAAAILDHALPSLTEALARMEAELAEALGEIRIYQQKFRYIAEGGAFYLSTAAECVRLTSSFLAMHANTAQAEQQEARPQDWMPSWWDEMSAAFKARRDAQGAQAGEFKREDRYIVIKRKDLDQLPPVVRVPFIQAMSQLGPELPRRDYLVIESDWPEYEPTWAAIEARMTGKGAQAGDDRAAFEKFMHSQGCSTEKTDCSDPIYFKRDVQGCWLTWQARAALATQPAAGEPIGWLRLEPDDNETASYHFYSHAVEGSSAVCFVTATPAAAHGDSFRTWLAAEMPAGTVIGDPAWWAERILKRIGPAAHGDEAVQYRLLRVGEIIQATDELLRDDCTTWTPMSEGRQLGIGWGWHAGLMPVRRIDAAMRAQGDDKKEVR
ncbi:hypothetical protein [Pseudomonas oryzihabitans]|uniref:hypothetical protein n=1 Tax=Pseudomonas oryzihabitans TaxID=47885 RepID=UPI00111DA6BD|nr:hypothetical protein [Pseudomonas psychrotolerans]QDD91897.1 hypothetical protein CCZ28_23940 [Pseudomonas psychrotolerans]QDD91953.1 hypothetical protein CCZ28_24250 [Pseudomonas psychrotolerans]